MIYLLYGTDKIKSRNKLRTLLDDMLTKKPDISYIRVDDESFEESRLNEFIGSQGLFENKYIIVFDNLFLDKNTKEILLKNLKEIAGSQNIFIFLEEKLNKTELNKLEKYVKKIQSFQLDNNVAKLNKFDIFTLADALGRRNKKDLWTLYQKAKSNNISDEEIYGILFWQIKSMLLSLNVKDAKESGLNPFVFRKSLGFLKNYSETDLKRFSRALVSFYHDSRRGARELGTALEMFILSIDKKF